MRQYKAGQQEIAPDRHLGTQAPISGSTVAWSLRVLHWITCSTVPWSLRVLPSITYTGWPLEGETV